MAKYLVIKTHEATPAEICLTTRSIDKAIWYVIDQVTATGKTLARKGYRLGFMTSARRKGYLGNIFIAESSRKGKKFEEAFESQYAHIRYKISTALYDRKATAVFVNEEQVMFGNEHTAFTVIQVK